MTTPTIIEALKDDQLLGRSGLGEESWSSWHVCLKSIFGLPMEASELDIFRQHTGRKNPPSKQVKEAWIPTGRRGGKSRVAAAIASYLSCFRSYDEYLSGGEKAYVLLIAADQRQAKVEFGYIRSMLTESPLLSKMIVKELKDSIQLNNNVVVEVRSCNFRTVRGVTTAAVIASECAFWRLDEASDSPDTEVISALRPTAATIPSSMIVGVSSPYSKKGLLWRMFSDYYGNDSDRYLIWSAPSLAMNPTLDPVIVEKALEDDPEGAKAEYLAQFRDDISGYVSREVIESLVIPGRLSLPPQPSIHYVGFVDAGGGSGDAMTLAIAHNDDGTAVLDCLVEKRSPFSPREAVAEFSKTLKIYNILECQADKYALRWPGDRFAEFGIRYTQSAQPKSDIYRELLGSINAGQIELLDNKRLISQFLNLERRTGRSGKDLITEGNLPDDLVNAAAGALLLALENSSSVSVAALASGWAQHKDPSYLIDRSRNSPSMQANRTSPSFTGTNWSVRR